MKSGGAGIDWGGGFRVPTSYYQKVDTHLTVGTQPRGSLAPLGSERVRAAARAHGGKQFRGAGGGSVQQRAGKRAGVTLVLLHQLLRLQRAHLLPGHAYVRSFAHLQVGLVKKSIEICLC